MSELNPERYGARFYSFPFLKMTPSLYSRKFHRYTKKFVELCVKIFSYKTIKGRLTTLTDLVILVSSPVMG